MKFVYMGSIKRIKKFFIKNKYLVLLMVVGAFLRLTNLGYSNYQGDEIKALFNPTDGQSVVKFLLDQRKGPVQFLITFLLKFLNPSYENEFLVRLPFAIAGILAVFYFYKLLKHHFNEKVAFYGTFFFATNGFLLAFSRIVQYQSFVILFMIMALYYLSEKKIFWGLLFWGLAFLSHYDAVLIAPFAFYLLYDWLKDFKREERIRRFIRVSIIPAFMTGVFYIPFLFNLSEATKTYWYNRLIDNALGKISSSKYLFGVYQPIYVIHIYTILFLLGLIFLCGGALLKRKLPEPKIISIGLWFLLALAFMEVFVHIPGTHIYTYLIPVMIFMGAGVYLIEEVLRKVLKNKLGGIVTTFGVSIIFVFIFAQMYMVYVNNRDEYPWENEQFLLWTLPKPSPIFHLSMFGFPYYRNWEGVKRFVATHPEIKGYSSNERKAITRYFINLPKRGDVPSFYILVKNPQSFTDYPENTTTQEWMQNHAPEYEFVRNSDERIKIYLLPAGAPEVVVGDIE